MADITYKCPACGGYLTFEPDGGQWTCPFCHSSYQEGDLLAKEKAREGSAAAPGPEGAQVVYHCPSCGSEIVTDETTVATNCYYCHSPVVLQGKLADDMRPDSVLPFTIDREKAAEAFLDWTRRKRFVPRGFFSAAKLRQVSGVYYPHFVTDCEAEGAIDGEGRNISVADTPKYVVTSTRHYHVRREGRLRFRGIMRPALSSADRKLSDGIHPFPLEDAKPFAGAYLSGFLAERRDLDADSIREDVEREVRSYVEPLLADDLHYDSYDVDASARLENSATRYVLLPTWVITYPDRRDPLHPYYYAMNGCTGEVCGKLPIDRKKLYLTAGGIAAAVFAAACALCYFLF